MRQPKYIFYICALRKYDIILEMHFTWGPNYTSIINLFLYLQDALFALVHTKSSLQTNETVHKLRHWFGTKSTDPLAIWDTESTESNHNNISLRGSHNDWSNIREGHSSSLTCCKWHWLKKGNKKNKRSSERKHKKHPGEKGQSWGEKVWRKKRHEYILSSPSGCCFA